MKLLALMLVALSASANVSKDCEGDCQAQFERDMFDISQSITFIKRSCCSSSGGEFIPPPEGGEWGYCSGLWPNNKEGYRAYKQCTIDAFGGTEDEYFARLGKEAKKRLEECLASCGNSSCSAAEDAGLAEALSAKGQCGNSNVGTE